MYFTEQELNLINCDKIFTKIIDNNKYWIKPLIDYSNNDYNLGDIKHHKIYLKVLKKYLGNHYPNYSLEKIPDTLIKKQRLKIDAITLIIQENVEGVFVKTLKELKNLINLPINQNFKEGLKKLLEDKKWVIDFFIYKKNILKTKNSKLIYVDSRMPVFTDNSEKRYLISKKRTLTLI